MILAPFNARVRCPRLLSCIIDSCTLVQDAPAPLRFCYNGRDWCGVSCNGSLRTRTVSPLLSPSKIRDAVGGLFDPLQLKVPLLNLWTAVLALP
jgi:hypothetical protein